MLKSIKLCLAVFLLTTSTISHAGLIEFREYQGNANGLIYVEDLGLEFLSLSFTAGQSFDAASANYSPLGFSTGSLATANQLFTALGIPNYTDRTTPNWVIDPSTVVVNGDQTSLWSNPWFTWFGDFNSSTTHKDAWLLMNADGTTLQAGVIPYYFIDQDGTAGNDADIILSSLSTTSAYTYRATLLYREASQVPEPSTLAIFGMSILGFALRKKALKR